MQLIPIIGVLAGASCASAQITYLTYSRTVYAIATETTDSPCFAIRYEESHASSDPLPQSLHADVFGMNYHGPDRTPGTPSIGHADVTTRFEPSAIYVQASSYGQDGLCGCAGSGVGYGEVWVETTISTSSEGLWVLDCSTPITGPGSASAIHIFDPAAPHGPPPLFSPYSELNSRHTAILAAGTYAVHATINGGWYPRPGCGPGTGVLDARLSFGCPCIADFDRSGGTPDTTDVALYFDLWLAGNATTDTDCSGGTPDTNDVELFFTQWLAGGC